MDIKLLALDIDGTLLNSQFQVSEANREAIHACVQLGVLVVLVTGRRFIIAQPIALELGLSTPLISHNGALTKDVRSYGIIDYHPLEAELARQAVWMGRKSGADMVCCYDPEGAGRVLLETISKDNEKLRRYLEKSPLVIDRVDDLVASITADPIQVMSSGPCDTMDQLETVLAQSMGDRVKLLKTAYPTRDFTILDILAPHCSKGAALMKVVDRYGLKAQDVMAIGDNHNDSEMLKFAGLSVVMGNAEQELKQAGYQVTDSNDMDGVAQAIRKFILNP